jgi:hypothetical protein
MDKETWAWSCDIPPIPAAVTTRLRTYVGNGRLLTCHLAKTRMPGTFKRLDTNTPTGNMFYSENLYHTTRLQQW